MQSPQAVSHPPARQPHAFYGWHMVVLCTIARGFTAPGQTIGVSAFTDDLIESLGTTRSVYSTAYMVGTLTGAVALPLIGRWVDRAGVKRTLSIVAVAFSCAVMLTGTVQNIVMLAVAFVGLRMLGQGSLSLIGTQGVVLWFERRRGFALAVSNIGTFAIMFLSPLLFALIIGGVGWRWAWVVIGAIVVLVLLPIARFGIVDRPEDIGQVPDGTLSSQPIEQIRGRSYSVSEAVRTPAFWTLTGVTFMAGAIVTGLTLHNTDVLGGQGLDETEAASVFIAQLVGSISASFVVGWLTDRLPGRPLIFFGGATLALGILLAITVEPGALAYTYGLVLGLGMGSISSLGSTLYPKWFGVEHIGSIKGVASTVGVVASAIGPLILSIGNDLAGSYRPVIIGCAIATAAVASLALLVPTPDRTITS